MSLPTVLLLGPSRKAISGVSTHVNLLLDSALGRHFELVHFQVGSEGRSESRAARLARFVGSPFALAAAILRHDAALVHVNCSLNAKSWWRDLAYMAVAKLCGARVVFQKHGGDLETFASGRLFRRIVRAALRVADAIVVLSRRELEMFGRALPGARIAVVPNGIDPAPFLRHPRAPAAGLRLLYIGRLAAGKGLGESIEALALTRARGLEPRLVIAGTGPEEAQLRERAAALGVSDMVSFAGPAWGELKLRLLGNADVLLLPSYSEGLPYALLEGMAAGLVPVVTPVGAVTDVVADGVHGRLVPVKDARAIAGAIEDLARDANSLSRMSEACRRRIAAAYSLERVAGDMSAVYSMVIPWPASQTG